jgi:two-component system sensor histidine kinase MprB
MTLRVRLALALGLLTAAAVSAMAFVGYRTTSTRLYDEIDRSLTSSASRFADPDGNYARLVCGQISQNEPVDEGQRELADLPGTTVQCLDSTAKAYAVSSNDVIPVDAIDARLATSGGATTIRTAGDDRIITVPLAGGGAVQLARDLDEVNRVLATLRTRFAIIGAIVTGLAALVGWVIARRVTRPVERLTSATESIVESGRLDADVPTGGRDETGRLAASFATMLRTLRESRQQQQRLAQDAGHELRTPLTSLRTNVEVLRRYPDLPAGTRDEVLADVDSELRELSHLTNELVALASEETDDEPEQEVDLAQLARRAAARAQRRRHRPVVVAGTGSSIVMGKPRQLLRVVDNLLDNACKFDSSDAPIEVTVGPGTLTVRDHGIGIDQADIGRLFDRFYRAPAARTMPGSGLGLSIARDIVIAHGGELSAVAEPGGGASFTVSLPPHALVEDDLRSHPGLTDVPIESYVGDRELES